MSNFFHRLIALLAGLGAVLPASDVLPAGTPKALKVGMAVTSVAIAIATQASKVIGKKAAP